MTLDELLEQFDEVLDSGIKIPGKKTVVDIEKLRAVVDDIRLNIPAEIKQAKGIVADRADIITNAKREADGIIRNAEERAKAMTAQEEIVKLAQQKAAEIIATSIRSSGRRMTIWDIIESLKRPGLCRILWMILCAAPMKVLPLI
mgnify:CR=1 FL=1